MRPLRILMRAQWERAVRDLDNLPTASPYAVSFFTLPRHWKFVDGFPMTVTGKIQKFKMRETAIDELGLGKAAGVRTA